MIIAGVDEVGRGPLAGPVVAAAVILNDDKPIAGIKDSKALTEKKRTDLSQIIKDNALAWAIAWADVEEIDHLNIFHASLLAMKRAVEQLSIMPELALIDGKFCPDLVCKTRPIIKGDMTEPSIGAASIIAKHYRDTLLIELDEDYPQYGFKQHKGYPTKQHVAALNEHGVTPHHRRSYAPVKKVLET